MNNNNNSISASCQPNEKCSPVTNAIPVSSAHRKCVCVTEPECLTSVCVCHPFSINLSSRKLKHRLADVFFLFQVIS